MSQNDIPDAVLDLLSGFDPSVQNRIIDAYLRAPPSRRDLAMVRKRGPYQVLGVSPTASVKEVKSAWKNLARKFHPDLFTKQGPVAVAKAEKRMTAINAAISELGRIWKAESRVAVTRLPAGVDPKRAALLTRDELIRLASLFHGQKLLMKRAKVRLKRHERLTQELREKQVSPGSIEELNLQLARETLLSNLADRFQPVTIAFRRAGRIVRRRYKVSAALLAAIIGGAYLYSRRHGGFIQLPAPK